MILREGPNQAMGEPGTVQLTYPVRLLIHYARVYTGRKHGRDSCTKEKKMWEGDNSFTSYLGLLVARRKLCFLFGDVCSAVPR